MNKKNVTFSDIAAYTNFSKTTISRYFNNPDSLTEENQKIIADALTALDYKENKVARILANGKTEFIGIIIPSLFFRFFSEMLDKILGTYETYGYKFLVFLGDEKKEAEEKYLQELLAYKIEGLIIMSHTISSGELASYQVPVVAIEREAEHIFSVETDNYKGAYEAAQILSEDGCQALFHINSFPDEQEPDYKRITGFCDCAQKSGLPYRVLRENFGFEYEDTHSKLKRMFEEIEKKYPDKRKGVFISNDTHANIFMNIVLRSGRRVPEDYEIIGFDDSPASREAIIPFTTVGQDTKRLAEAAMELLVRQIEARKKRHADQELQPEHRVVEPAVIRRESTLNLVQHKTQEEK